MLTNILLRALGERRQSKPRSRANRIVIACDDYGPAKVHVVFGDADGSGEAPCVQLEIHHEFIPGGCAAIAMTARESNLVERALATQRMKLKPHEGLRARKRKWEMMTSA